MPAGSQVPRRSRSYDLGEEYIEDALSENEAAHGYVLTCQMRAESDCVIRVPASSDVCKTTQASYQATISNVRQLSQSTIALSIKGESLSQAGLPAWAVRQPAGAGTDQTRAYRSARCRRAVRSAS